MDWTEIIGKVGFPVATVIYLLWQSKMRDDKSQDRMDNLDEFIRTDLKTIAENDAKVIATNNEILIKNTKALEQCNIELAKKKDVA